MSTPSDLRRSLRARRRALTPDQRLDLASRIADHLTAARVFSTSHRIAAYLAANSEVDIAPVIQRAWRERKQVYLPRLSGPFHNHLRFAPHVPQQRLVRNRFGIPEPAVPHARCVSGTGLDLVVMPLVAFDTAGTRLGMGGGYYDRTFAFRRFRSVWIKPILVGVAFEVQRVATLTRSPWDVPLDAVVTENGIEWFEASRFQV